MIKALYLQLEAGDWDPGETRVMGHGWVIYLGRARGRQWLNFCSLHGCGRSTMNPIKECEVQQITGGPHLIDEHPVLDRGQRTESNSFLLSSLSLTG